jgi:LEA14-like dessication related protein
MIHSVARLTAILALLVLAGCASLSSLEAPEVRVTSLEWLEPAQGSLEQRFAVGLRLVNPNNRALMVDGLDFDLDLNGRRLARGVTNRAFELPRLGEAETSIIVTTSVIDLLRQALEIGSRTDMTGMDYELRGRVHLGSGFVRTVPFSHRGKVAP